MDEGTKSLIRDNDAALSEGKGWAHRRGMGF